MSTDSRGDAKLSVADYPVPETNVSVYEALYQRRMAWEFKSDPVPKEALDRMLQTAVWAPNHRLTEPWRFFVLEKGSDALDKAAGLAYDFSMQRNNNPQRAEATRQSMLNTPVLMYLYYTPGRDEEGTRENYASVCCAAQNMALAGVAEGLAVTWETGGPTRHPDLAETLGAGDGWMLATMLSIGYPAEDPDSQRTPVGNFINWLD